MQELKKGKVVVIKTYCTNNINEKKFRVKKGRNKIRKASINITHLKKVSNACVNVALNLFVCTLRICTGMEKPKIIYLTHFGRFNEYSW